ncbi:MAG: hypothetical protein H0X24_02865 [Ktedonobacterales bacterium]|nr:hypothetical protein [Ktedonobacterales bacterium]
MDDETREYNEWAHRISTQGTKQIPGVQLTLFEQFSIRRTWHEGEWWYSLVDCMVPLSGTPNPARYWMDLKKRMLYEEEVNVTTLGVLILKLPTQRGQMRATDCASAEILLRVVQSVRSPKAEPFKVWLARVGALVMDDQAEHTERVSHRTRLYYFDRELHDVATDHGVASPREHAALDDANWAGLYLVSGEIDLIRTYRPGRFPADLEATMGSTELGANIFQRVLAKQVIADRNLHGIGPIAGAARDVGQAVREALAQTGTAMPEDMPQYPPLMPGEWMPPDHPSRIDWDAPAEIAGANDDGPDIPFIEIVAPE